MKINMETETQDYIDNYYARTLPEDKPYPALEGTIETDVCVIGGGMAGLAVALGLVERGKKVVLLEGRRLGWGASGRNGGFCMAGYALGNEDAKTLARKVGLPRARELFQLTRDAQSLIRGRIAKYKIPCDVVDGQVIASWHENSDEQKRVIDYMAKNFDIHYEFWPRKKVRELYSTDRYYDATFLPGNFHMHPLRYIHGIAAEITRTGGEIFEKTAAVKLDKSSDTKIVYTDRGQVKAQHVVFCGSAYFLPALDWRLKQSCLPVSTYVMVTEVLSKQKMESAIRAPYAIHDTRFAYDYYRPTADNRLLWGGRVAYNKTPSQLANIMHKDMAKIYPQLADVKAEMSWTGLMGYTVHKMPHIGKFADGLWYCTNFGGNGVGPTTAGGEAIASAIAQGDETYKMYEPFGFEYTGGALGPYVARAVYYGWEISDKILDWKSERARKKAA